MLYTRAVALERTYTRLVLKHWLGTKKGCLTTALFTCYADLFLEFIPEYLSTNLITSNGGGGGCVVSSIDILLIKWVGESHRNG